MNGNISMIEKLEMLRRAKPSNNPFDSVQEPLPASPTFPEFSSTTITSKQDKAANENENLPKTVDSGGVSSTLILPFQISVTKNSLIAAPGVVFTDPHPQTISEILTNGTWYLQAGITINPQTGAKTASEVLWTSTEKISEGTDFYRTLGEVQIINNIPDSSTIVQYAYGPLTLVLYGGANNKWEAQIF